MPDNTYIAMPLGRRWRLTIVLPLALFAVMSLVLWTQGVRYGVDTPFYLASADALRAGELPHVGYLGYIAYLAAFRIIGLGPGAIVLGQLLLSGLVVIALYDLGRRIDGRLAGMAAASGYALNLDITRFTFYVLSDSLFTSMVLLAVYATYRATTAASRRWTVAAVVSTSMLGLLRFNGWFMFPVLMEWLLRESTLALRPKRVIRLGLGVCYLAMLVAAMASTRSPQFGNDLLRGGRIVWADDASVIRMPAGPQRLAWLPPAVDYALQHPVETAALVARRIATEAWHTRRFYSRRHNVAIVLTLPVLYVLAAIGLRRHWPLPVARVCATLFGVEMLLVGLAAADWDGRYLIMVVPILTLWAGIAAAWVWVRLTGGLGWWLSGQSQTV